MSDLTPTAVVTGASRGIGKTIAETLAARGFQIYFTYVSKPESAQTVVDSIKAAGGKASAFKVDVTSAEEVSNFFQNEIKEKVSLDVLVNNAGITRDKLLLRMSDDDFDAVITTNLRGPFICTREAAKIMTKQRYGSIVNIASISGLMGTPGQANYSSAKAGLIGLTKATAKELAARNIRVNAVAPGYIVTDMTNVLSDEVQAEYMRLIPLKRGGTPQDVANAVAFLASEQSSYITGQVLSVNGGMYC